jgi:hypothetical protein
MYFIVKSQSGGLHRSEMYMVVVIDEGCDIVSSLKCRVWSRVDETLLAAATTELSGVVRNRDGFAPLRDMQCGVLLS